MEKVGKMDLYDERGCCPWGARPVESTAYVVGFQNNSRPQGAQQDGWHLHTNPSVATK